MTVRLGCNSKPKAIDLFAGCGGLSQGLRDAGFQVIAAIELDDLAARSYKLNHRRTQLITDDIRNVKASTLRSLLGLDKYELDLLAACPPCQGFSTHRTRNGKRRPRDPRNYLIRDIIRFARAFRPKALLIENVPGLAKHALFREARKDLVRLGYNVCTSIIDAADYGVPQRRKRLIVSASRVCEPKIDRPNVRTMTVRDAIWHLPCPRDSDDPLHNYREQRSPKVRRRIRAIPLDGGSRSALSVEDTLHCHRATTGYKDVYGRLRWDDIAPTITSGCINPSRGRFLHPRQHRAITLREAALLQTFPEDYRFCLSKGRYAVATMIGNALPPKLIHKHAEEISRMLKRARMADTSRKSGTSALKRSKRSARVLR